MTAGSAECLRYERLQIANATTPEPPTMITGGSPMFR